MATDECWIYFIEAGKFIKIGFSRDVQERLQTIDTACPHKATLLYKIPGSPELERRLHKRFKHLRRRKEWFHKNQEILDFISYIRRMSRLHFDHLKWPFDEQNENRSTEQTVQFFS